MIPTAGKVSIIIPGRREKFFQKTLDSALDTATGDIEIIAIVDEEEWEEPLQSSDKRVTIVRMPKAIGQRAAYNYGVSRSKGEYVMKIDAHCKLSKGFDVALKGVCGPKTVVLPEMRRLNPHEWVYKRGGETLSMNFGIDLYCHYWPEYLKRDGVAQDDVEVMTGQGSCWFTTREWNDHIGLLNEAAGSWGNVGIEVSLRTWLCGGSQIATKKAWQAHYFRKDEGGFPYHLTGRDVHKAHQFTLNNYYFKNDAFYNQTRPFKWLIEKFQPVPQWEAYMVDEYKSPRVILYYTHNKLEEGLAGAVRKRLNKICGPIPIYSVSQQPLKFGKNICVGEKPLTYQTMYEQIRDGLKAIPANSIVYLCEHDVFYHASHFAMLPKDNRHVWFNTNRYYWAPGMNGFYPARGKRALSQGVAYRDCWLRHVEDRLEEWKTNPETKMKVSYFNYRSERPNVDVRNGQNLTIAGHYKRKHERGELPNETNLPGWGTVKHFLSVVGYAPAVGLKEEKLNAQAYLAKKYGRRMPQPSPIRCPGLKRRSLPKIWQACGYSKGAEVGVRQGHFSEIICKAMPGLSLSCVDIWGEYYHFDSEYGKENLALCKKRLAAYKVEFINKPSVEAAMSMEDNALDFVYIDADHRFDYVMEDLIWWNRKVRPGGIVSGHDYYRFRNAGVVPAVDVFTYNHDIREWFITDEKEASFFWVKPDKDGFH